MAYIRTHTTKTTARGKVVKTYAVVYRAKIRTDDGRTVTRLRQDPRHQGRRRSSRGRTEFAPPSPRVRLEGVAP